MNIIPMLEEIASGVPLKIIVENDIHFGPVSQRTFGDIPERIVLGLAIGWKLNGCWQADAEGRVVRMCTVPHLTRTVIVDLRGLELEDVRKIYAMLTRFSLPRAGQTKQEARHALSP